MPFATVAGPSARAALRDVRHETLWLADAARPAAQPALRGEIQADLVVVGAGLSGLWTALRAKERQPEVRVVLLEGDRIANAASGRNGGFVSSSITHGYANGLERWPEEFARLVTLGHENFAAIGDTITKYAIDCDYAVVGEFDVATEPHQVQHLRDHALTFAPYGVDLVEYDGPAIRAQVDSPTYRGALFDPAVATVNPARLAWGLARVAEDLGVQIHENSAALGVDRDGARLTVRTPGGSVVASRVALTTAAHKPLLRRIGAYVVPVFDHVIATAPLPSDVLETLGWQGRQGIADSGNLFHYYRLTGDGRILWGGYDAIYQRGERPGSTLERDDEITARLVQHLHDTFPQVAQIPIDFAWAGAIDTCARFSAFWGLAHSGQLAYVAGYTGLGVGASRFGADVLLDLLWDEPSERTALQMVRSKPLPFPPGPVRQWGIDITRRSLLAADANGGRRNLWLRTLDRFGLGFDS